MELLIPPISHNKEKGFTFLETLVSIFVFSIGLLGMVHMQIVSTTFNQQSYGHTQMLYVVGRLVNIINLYAVNGTDTKKFTTPLSNIGTCLIKSTTVPNEINCFYQKIADSLPYGTGTIFRDRNGVFTITVYWLEKSTTNHKNGESKNCPPPYTWSDSSTMQQSVLSWPAANKPKTKICMVSKQWQFLP